MGKYIIYAVMIFIVLFALNFFKIIDIPFLDVPDITDDKQESITRSQDALKQLE
jgi:hypothetical protein